MNHLILNCVGGHTSMGGIADAAAAFRVGFTFPNELENWPYFDSQEKEEHFLASFPAAGIAKGFDSFARYVKLFVAGLIDFEQQLRISDIELNNKTCLILVLPDIPLLQDYRKKLTTRFCQESQRILNFNFSAEENLKLVLDENGVAASFNLAKQFIAEGRYENCIVGVIDSLIEFFTLTQLVRDGVLKTLDKPDGKVPGEASIFILLSGRTLKTDTVIFRNIPNQVKLHYGENDPLEYQISAKELTESILTSIDSVPEASLQKGTIYNSFTGAALDASEISNAFIRASTIFPINNWTKEYPAVSFGDVGVASLLLNIALAYRAYCRNYSLGNLTMIISQNISLYRSVLLMEKL